MKIVGIGDIHGRTVWEKIVKAEHDADKFVFVGDYFDSEHITPMYQIHNFKEICQFKRENPEKVVLLFGNHDFHYLRGINEHYDGYSPIHCLQIQEEMHYALSDDLLQMCYLNGHYLFSHAGVTKTWCAERGIKTDRANIVHDINMFFKFKPRAFQFTSGPNHNKYGDDIFQSPIWVRPKSLMMDGLDNYTHIVGHTRQKDGIRKINTATDRGIILIDSLGTKDEYLRIVDGLEQVMKCPR